MKELRVGTRGSKLAIAQTNIVLESLSRVNPVFEYEIVKIVTSGDLDKQQALFSMDRKGLFEKEINEAVLNDEVDIAIHSIKDVPSKLNENLTISSIPRRESINDVLISKRKRKLIDLPSNSVIGTSSLRRAIQLINLRKDLIVKPIRGNIDTRIDKTLKGDYDGIILAEAGLKRLRKLNVISQRLEITEFLPAPGQGALGIVSKKNNKTLINFLKKIEDEPSRKSIEVERTFISRIEGGCRFPIGACAIASKKNNSIRFFSKIFSSDGSEQLIVKKIGSYDSPKRLGNISAKYLLRNGAARFAQGWDKAVDEWNKKNY